VCEFKARLGKVIETPSQKQNTNQKIGGITQEVEHLSKKCEDLGSISGITKINKNE
jgi:hypothetical protein